MHLRELQVSYRIPPGAPDGPRPQILTPKDALAIVGPLLAGKVVEHFGVLSLDTRHRVIGWDVVSIGTLDADIVHPREVFLTAVLQHAAAVIVVHNHPSGDPSPSQDDRAIARRLKQCGELLGIAVLDSLIVADGGLFVSLRDGRTGGGMNVGIYVRVSSADQHPENQLEELRRYVGARGWTATEYVDHGVSGAKDRRPPLDQLTSDVRRHKLDAVICWRLDRLGRNLRHLVLLLDEWQSRGVAFVTLGEGIDTSTPAGRLVAGVLASIAEFERSRIQERIRAGLARAKAQGQRLGRPKQDAPVERLQAVHGLSVREGARRLGVAPSTLLRWRRAVQTSNVLQESSRTGR